MEIPEKLREKDINPNFKALGKIQDSEITAEAAPTSRNGITKSDALLKNGMSPMRPHITEKMVTYVAE